MPENISELSVEQMTNVLEVFCKDPYFLDGLSTPALETLLHQVQDELDALESDEPEDDDDAYEQWEESIDELKDKIESIQNRLLRQNIPEK